MLFVLVNVPGDFDIGGYVRGPMWPEEIVSGPESDHRRVHLDEERHGNALTCGTVCTTCSNRRGLKKQVPTRKIRANTMAQHVDKKK